MERTIQGVVMLILTVIVAGLLINDSGNSLKRWGESRKYGCEDKHSRNFAILEMISAYILAFAMGLAVTQEFFWR